MSHQLEIACCTQRRWLLRAAWMAQELLTTFETELTEVALRPGTGGIFEVRLDGGTLFCRKGGRAVSGIEGVEAARPRPHRARPRPGPQRP